MQTLESLKMSATYSGPKTITKGKEKWKCNWWILTFTRGNRSESFDFYVGVRIPKTKKPDPVEVLACISRDYLSTNNVAYEDWAAEFGYDPDSRSGEETYNQCRAIGLRLLNLLIISELDQLAAMEF